MLSKNSANNRMPERCPLRDPERGGIVVDAPIGLHCLQQCVAQARKTGRLRNDETITTLPAVHSMSSDELIDANLTARVSLEVLDDSADRRFTRELCLDPIEPNEAWGAVTSRRQFDFTCELEQ